MNFNDYLNLVAFLIMLWGFIILVKVSNGMNLWNAIVGASMVSITIGWVYLGIILWQLK